jgi:hypothetical protein
MRKLIIGFAALASVPAIGFAAPVVDATLQSGRVVNTDLGCLTGQLRATRYPSSTYDKANHEQITYNISACTGGYIMGVNSDTGAKWHADIAYNGVIKGQDLDGDRWEYSPTSRVYNNLTTGRSCQSSSLRHVCTP